MKHDFAEALGLAYTPYCLANLMFRHSRKLNKRK